MKILSLNLHCFRESNYLEKFDIIASFIMNNDIDVILFQEACYNPENKLCNAKYIADKVNYKYHFQGFKKAWNIYDEGLAILSKYEIKNVELKTVSKTLDSNNWQRRDILKASINGINYVTTHIGWDSEEETAMNQLAKLTDYVDSLSGVTVIAGDFNHAYQTKEINYLSSKYINAAEKMGIDCLNTPTFIYDLDSKEETTNKMIDYIFINDNIVINKFSLVFTNEIVSDHYGLLVEI